MAINPWIYFSFTRGYCKDSPTTTTVYLENNIKSLCSSGSGLERFPFPVCLSKIVSDDRQSLSVLNSIRTRKKLFQRFQRRKLDLINNTMDL